MGGVVVAAVGSFRVSSRGVINDRTQRSARKVPRRMAGRKELAGAGLQGLLLVAVRR